MSGNIRQGHARSGEITQGHRKSSKVEEYLKYSKRKKVIALLQEMRKKYLWQVTVAATAHWSDEMCNAEKCSQFGAGGLGLG